MDTQLSPRRSTRSAQLPGLEGSPAQLRIRIPNPRFERTCMVNTTTRRLSARLDHWTVLLDLRDELTVANHPTADSAVAAVADAWAELEGGAAVSAEVVRKVVLSAESLGMLEWHNRPRNGRYLEVFPAGEALLTEPDSLAFLACVLVRLPGLGEGATRWAVGALRFAVTCHDDYDQPWVALDHFALRWAGAHKEGPWGREARAVAASSSPVPREAFLERLIDWDPYRAAVSAAFNDALADADALSEDAAREALAAVVQEALPSARRPRVNDVLGEVAALVASGDTPAAVNLVCESTASTKIASLLDQTGSSLRYLVEVGLLEENDARQYRVSRFGREVLDSLPKEPPASRAAAFAAVRTTVATPYAGRRQERAERFDDLRRHDGTQAGRTALARAIDWSIYEGASRFAEFELAVYRATLTLVDPHLQLSTLKILEEGLRTRVGYDYTALAAAPGGGPDGLISLPDVDVVVEASGTTGNNLIKQELEPVTRHVREHAWRSGKTAVGVLVCPEVDDRMAMLLLAEAQPDPEREDRPPAPVVPVTTDQLQRMLEDGVDLAGVLTAARARVLELAESPTWRAGRELLSEVERIIAMHTPGDDSA